MRLAKKIVGNDVALNVVGSGVDQAADAIAEILLDSVLGDEPRGTEKLDGIEAILDETVGHIKLCNGRCKRGVFPLRLIQPIL